MQVSRVDLCMIFQVPVQPVKQHVYVIPNIFLEIQRYCMSRLHIQYKRRQNIVLYMINIDIFVMESERIKILNLNVLKSL